jgi:hypothetical protein
MVRRLLPMACALLCAAVATAPANAARPLDLGFFDSVFTGSQSVPWLERAAAAGSDVVRIDIGWDAPNTPQEPAGFDPTNPADSHYDFAAADAAIRAATADGLKVIATFTGAPRWAEGRRMPAGATPGTWRPRPRALEQYAIALGRRYSGRFRDPLHPGRFLPRVWAFQVWNEPNLSVYLAPQWSGTRPESPILYRALLNAFYRGVKSVDPDALVVTAGTAPFGDPGPGGDRIMPADFWRVLLCERLATGGAIHGTPCPDPAHFDVMAHHPYSVGDPETKALNADDVSIPDLWKLTRLLRFAERTGRALPSIQHQLWITEVGYNTKPPNPAAVPITEAGRWLEQTLELLWQQGVSVITWNTIVDQPPIPNYSSTSQSGVYFLNGTPKQAPLAAFRFPLVAWRTRHVIAVWGRAPVAGRLAIEKRSGSLWRRISTLAVKRHEVFELHLRAGSGGLELRAEVGGQASLPWRLG